MNVIKRGMQRVAANLVQIIVYSGERHCNVSLFNPRLWMFNFSVSYYELNYIFLSADCLLTGV